MIKSFLAHNKWRLASTIILLVLAIAAFILDSRELAFGVVMLGMLAVLFLTKR